MARTKKAPVKYTIEMDIKSFFILFSLVLLLGFTIFYLGIMFGKSLRDPNEEPIAQVSSPVEIAESKVTENVEPTKDLTVFDMRDNSGAKTKYQSEFEKLLKQTDSLPSIETDKNAKKQNKVANVPKKIAETKKPTPVATKTPSKKVEDKTLYTIQVLATTDRTKATRIEKLLKGKKFEAYIEKYQLSTDRNPVYRVRVGKTSKKTAEATIGKLRNAVKGLGEPKLYQL